MILQQFLPFRFLHLILPVVVRVVELQTDREKIHPSESIAQ